MKKISGPQRKSVKVKVKISIGFLPFLLALVSKKHPPINEVSFMAPFWCSWLYIYNDDVQANGHVFEVAMLGSSGAKKLGDFFNLQSANGAPPLLVVDRLGARVAADLVGNVPVDESGFSRPEAADATHLAHVGPGSVRTCFHSN